MKIKKHQEYRRGFPYYKVQWYDTVSWVWRDIQKRFKSLSEARQYFNNKRGKWRVMEITRNGRHPL